LQKLRLSENLYVFAFGIAALAVAIAADENGMPQKWHAAIVGTVVAFGGSLWALKRKWKSASFWLAVITCFGFHVALMWLVFERVLSATKNVGILEWSPVAFAEWLILLLVIPFLQGGFSQSRNSQSL
jgi:hypothetical protein